MNAIILAAGLGTRLRPLTDTCPKCMVAVLGQPIVERQIRYLLDAGIDDITLVSGYCADRLGDLRHKYGVRMIHNSMYDRANNIYSMYLAREIFGDTYVLEGDVYMRRSCIDPAVDGSCYYAVSRAYEGEWGLETNADGILERVVVGDGDGCIMSGISYWTGADAGIISERITELVDSGDYADLFWDNAVIDVLPRLSGVRVREVTGLYEIDTVPELRALENLLRSC